MKAISTLLKFAVLTVLLAVNLNAYAKITGSAFPDLNSNPAVTGVDAEKIAALESRMRQFVAEGDSMGIATLLVRNGTVASYTQAGVRDLLNGEPITQESIYRIYSMSKPITGVAMMMLLEQGAFSLDDPVAKFIPEFEGLKVVKSYDLEGNIELEPLERQPTIRELMSHTAGFGYGLRGADPSNVQFRKKGVLASPDLQSLVDRVATIPLMHQPGTAWAYSVSVDLQGAIIERISGMSLGEFFQSKIFKPLGMVDTAFYVPAEKAERLADVFAYHPVTKNFQTLPFAEPQFNVLGDISYRKETRGMESGGGGLVSTMADYARFCQMMLNGGELNGARILSKQSIDLMVKNVLTDSQKINSNGNLNESASQRVGFGLNFGLFIGEASETSGYGDGSYFWGGAASTWFLIDPKNDLFFIGMVQQFPKPPPAVNPDFRKTSQQFVYDALTD